MADGESQQIAFARGYVLLWRVLGQPSETALQAALGMGVLADAHDLGSWSVAEIGLGDSCWFDLVLNKDIGAMFLKLIFGSLPDAAY